MIHTHSYKNSTWIDLEKPDKKEVIEVTEKYAIDPVVAKDLEIPTPKPKVEALDKSVYLVLHFPVLKHSHTISNNQEIDFVIGDNFLLTAHYDTIDALHRFGKTIETDSIINKKNVEISGSLLFYRIIKEIYHALYNELSYINSWLEDIDHKVFNGNERNMVRAISEANRALLRFKKTISINKEMFLALQTISSKTLGSELTYYSHILAQESSKMLTLIESYTDEVSELRETNNSLLSTRQNEITLSISLIALIALPLSLLISLFQIDAISRPIVGMPNDFWILAGGMALITIILFLIFKIKKLF